MCGMASSPNLSALHHAPADGPFPPSDEDIAKARERLAALCPVLRAAHAATPRFSWRMRPGGFAGLTRMIVEQQVSVAAAAAIWRRVEMGLGEVTPAAILARDDEALQSLGLSRPKVRYVRGLAQAVAGGALDFDRLPALSDAEATAALTALKGVGAWTAETFLMFCEGRRDMFPAADIALQEAHRAASGATLRLSSPALAERALAWRPHRSTAAQLLWAYYGVLRGRLAAAPHSANAAQ
jgi:DNA-3-methyladenine glycosylase II